MPDRTGRAAAVKRLSATMRRPSADAHTDVDRMIGGAPGAAPDSRRAALFAAGDPRGRAGRPGRDRPGRRRRRRHLGWLTDDYYLDHCLAEAKLSLYECLAVAKPNYEDVFCLGQHALKDTGACVVKSAWSTVPIDVMTHAMTIPAARIHKAPVRRRRRA